MSTTKFGKAMIVRLFDEIWKQIFFNQTYRYEIRCNFYESKTFLSVYEFYEAMKEYGLKDFLTSICVLVYLTIHLVENHVLENNIIII